MIRDVIADLFERLDRCRHHRGRDHVVDELLDLAEAQQETIQEQAATIDRLSQPAPAERHLVAHVGPPHPKERSHG